MSSTDPAKAMGHSLRGVPRKVCYDGISSLSIETVWSRVRDTRSTLVRLVTQIDETVRNEKVGTLTVDPTERLPADKAIRYD